MLRSAICAAVGLAIVAGGLRAEAPKEVKGLVKQADLEKGVIKVKVGEKEQTFQISKDTKFVDEKGKPLDKEQIGEQVTQGAQVCIQQQGTGEKTKTTKIQVQTIATKKKPGKDKEEKKEEDKKQGDK